MTFGLPLDPDFSVFKEGLKRADDDFFDTKRWRYRLSDKKWYVFPQEEWILEDVGISDTPPPNFGVPGDSSDYALGDLYKAIVAKYEAHKARYPTLVWTWLQGGDWRASWKRTSAPRRRDPTPPHLPAECVRKINEIDAWVRAGHLTPAQGANLKRVVIEECVRGLKA